MRDERVCPNCGSTDIGHDPVRIMSRLSLDHARECNACGYTGIFPLVAADDMDAFQESVDEQDEMAPPAAGFNRGRFTIGLVMLLMGGVSTFYGTWETGLLAGILALVIGAAVVFEQLSRT